MKKKSIIVCALSLIIGLGVSSAYAAPENTAAKCANGLDDDKDTLIDCADPNCAAFCGPTCTDTDADGYGNPGSSSCPNGSATDCNNNNAAINPGATEICGDGLDNDCVGGDATCPGNPHASLTWSQWMASPPVCKSCHSTQYTAMFNAKHYKWTGEAIDMVNQPGTLQGKLTNAVNSYCINIQGDWPVCGKCHAGRGIKPGSGDTVDNVDCLVCHSEEYALLRTRLSNGTMGVPTGTDTMVQNVSKPTRKACLKCHAYAGGGNAVKRGDISMADATVPVGSDNNTDPNFDVHMNLSGANLTCQSCHVFQNHKTIGKGSDLRGTDDVVRGSEIKCVTCHTGMDSGSGHLNAGANRTDADRHINRVACQACHVPTYAKVATEVNRDWRLHHDGRDATTCDATNPCPGHPHSTKAANLTPEYRFWNRLSDNYLLGDDATQTYDASRGTYPTSRPMGSIADGKLYAFKYKTADQPFHNASGQLIGLNTYIYMGTGQTGNVTEAILSGMGLQGLSGSYSWVKTDTLQMLNHGIPTAVTVSCAQCHPTGNLDTTTDSMLDKLGYKLKGPKAQICSQCHREKSPRDQVSMHNHLNKGSGIGCYFCHNVARPERGKCDPCNPACVAEFVDNQPYNHTCPPPNY